MIIWIIDFVSEVLITFLGPLTGVIDKSRDDRKLPDVTEGTRQTRAPLATLPEGLSVGGFIDDHLKKVCWNYFVK